MMGGDFSQPWTSTGSWGNDDDDEPLFGGQDSLYGAGALGRSSRRMITSGNLGSYLTMRESMDLQNGKTVRDGKASAALKKSNSHAGRTFKGKTKPLKSVTSNRLHAAVFPNMRVPVYMHKQNGKKGRTAFSSSGRGLTSNPRAEDVPVMSVQCPMPAGTSIATQTDPVQKVTWGSLSRIEASDYAKDLVKQLRNAVKTAKKAKAKRTGSKDTKSDENESEDEETSKPVKSHKKKEPTKQGDNERVAHSVSSKDGVTPDTVSVADTGASTDSMGNPNRSGFLKAPPGTPPDAVFHKEAPIAAALSTPTIPIMHHIVDIQLVEGLRIQHAKDPEAFEARTLDLKQSLIEAKVTRGGLPFLLREEYTVELASREGAELSEKWSKGQGKNRHFPGLRSRAGSLQSQPSTGSLRMRGGHADDSTTATTDKERGASGDTVMVTPPEPALSGTPGIDNDNSIPTLELPAPVVDAKLNASASATKEKKKSTKKDDANNNLIIHEIKKTLARLNLAEHVSKINTYGTVRSQSSVKREASDHGEKRTVKTWIEVTEVYEVPAPQKLTIKDIIATLDNEQVGSEGEWEDDTDNSDSDDDEGEKQISRMQKKKAKKGKKSTKKASGYNSDVSSSPSSNSGSGSGSGSGSASDHSSVDDEDGEEFYDAGETGPEALFRSLSRLEGTVDADSISRLTTDLGALMAGLGGADMLDDHEE